MLKRFLSVFVAVVFFIETTPDHLWHLFAHHHDTHDIYNSVGTAVSSHHLHCDALQDSMPAYNGDRTIQLSFQLVAERVVYFILPGLNGHAPLLFHSGLAPPALG